MKFDERNTQAKYFRVKMWCLGSIAAFAIGVVFVGTSDFVQWKKVSDALLLHALNSTNQAYSDSVAHFREASLAEAMSASVILLLTCLVMQLEWRQKQQALAINPR